MKDFIAVVQNLPFAGKLAVSVIILASALVLIYIVFQEHSKSVQAPANAIPSQAQPEALNQKSEMQVQPKSRSARLPDNEKLSKATSTPSQTGDQQNPTSSKGAEVIKVGDVTSNQQAGGITAGYVGNVKSD